MINSNVASFQAGVDSIYNTCKTYGSTPSAKTPAAINTSIQTIYNNRYNSGYANGKGIHIFVPHMGGLYNGGKRLHIIKLDKKYTKVTGTIPNLRKGVSDVQGCNQIAVIKNSGYTTASQVQSNLTFSTHSTYGRCATSINSGTIENKVIQKATGSNGDNLVGSGIDVTNAEYLIIASSTYQTATYNIDISIT